MLIDDKKWEEIGAATKIQIDRWNASAAKHGKKDTFRFSTQKTNRHEVILTEHNDGYNPKAKALAREIETGEIRATKVILDEKRRIVGFKLTTPDPKGWKALADKPAKEIVKKLKLTNFWMLLGTHVTEVQSTTI
jgi:hypothetical protein